MEERGAIQKLTKIRFSNCTIAEAINCSLSTVRYEIMCGTLEDAGRGRKPSYATKRGRQCGQGLRLSSQRYSMNKKAATYIAAFLLFDITVSIGLLF